MKELIGEDLFDQIEKADAICITTNCSILDDGTNPMGGGCAGTASRLWPVLPLVYANRLQFLPKMPCLLGYVYKSNKNDFIDPWVSSIEGISKAELCAIVAYPTMLFITEPANLELIVRSARLLPDMADHFGWESIVIPRMGSGIGGLNWEEQVKPAVENILDDRFTIIHKDFLGPLTRTWKSTTN